MNSLRISLLGKFQIQYGDHELSGVEARKVQELFCFLLLHRNVNHHREKLATLFWENQSTANSKKYLRQALWQLQSALEIPVAQRSHDCPPPLLVDDEWVRINPNCKFWLDIEILESTFTGIARTPGADITDTQASQMEEAVQLYTGDLLEGWYQDWCIFERERYQSIYLAALDKLIGYCEATHQFVQGVSYGTAILQHDRARECTHRHIMRLYYLSGDRTGALRQYDSCTTALHEELGVEPAQSTIELYQKICTDSLLPNTRFRDEGYKAEEFQQPTVDLAGSGLNDVLQTLHQLQKGVKALSIQLENCVHAIERTIQKS